MGFTALLMVLSIIWVCAFTFVVIVFIDTKRDLERRIGALEYDPPREELKRG